MVNNSSEALVGRFVARGHYDKKFIAQVVDEFLKGKSRQAILVEYGLKVTTLSRWLANSELMIRPVRIGPNVSIDLKRTVVRSVRSGRLSMHEAMLTYSVKTPKTIERWIQQLEEENADLVSPNEAWMEKINPTKRISRKTMQM